MTGRVLAVGTAERRTAEERREQAARRRAALMDPTGDHPADLPTDRRSWPDEWREAWEERAAVMEFDGELTSAAAEREAEVRVRAEHARVVAGARR